MSRENYDCLGDKLGPLLFQFGYFRQEGVRRDKRLLARLRHSSKNCKKITKSPVESETRLARPQFVKTLRERGLLLH